MMESVTEDGFGELRIVHQKGGGLRLRIDRADPRVRITGTLVRMALADGKEWLHPGAHLASDRLVIHGTDRKVIYRIGAYHEDGDWYEAEWPD